MTSPGPLVEIQNNYHKKVAGNTLYQNCTNGSARLKKWLPELKTNSISFLTTCTNSNNLKELLLLKILLLVELTINLLLKINSHDPGFMRAIQESRVLLY